MFSLEHSVHLSRRACRLLVLVLVLSAGVGLCTNGPPNHAADTFRHSQPDHDGLPADLSMLHQEGVTVRAVEDRVTEGAATTTETVGREETTFSSAKKEVQRYPVASVSFHRVETPFIIGMWIFCASLAKIGTCYRYNWHVRELAIQCFAEVV